jgi:carbamoyl-phosphate synthase small subunit
MKKKIKAKKVERALIALADGTIFHGNSFGAVRGVERAVIGEMVFNTSMYGYQEILTDPSYAGQIMTFTAAQIGNVGCNPEDDESAEVHVEGLVVRQLSTIVSNFRATQSLPEYLAERDVLGVSGIDTRAIVHHLRDKGAQMGAMASGDKVNPDDLVDQARAAGSMEGKEYVQQVSCKEIYSWNEPTWELSNDGSSSRTVLTEEELCARPHVVALDCGVKHNILRLLVDVGFRVTVMPATSSAAAILSQKPDGLFLSNGPGDPATLGFIVNTVRELVGRFPIFGICLGHQILGQVFGGKTYKLKFGHRGGNHPVMDLETKRVEITVQNHGFAVDAQSLPSSVKVSHINLNDQTVEGIAVPDKKIFSVQYHPEASPGPHDSRYLFRRFFESVVQ